MHWSGLVDAGPWGCWALIYWGLNKTATILLTTFSCIFFLFHLIFFHSNSPNLVRINTIANMSSMDHVMAWKWTSHRPLSESLLRHSTSVVHNELLVLLTLTPVTTVAKIHEVLSYILSNVMSSTRADLEGAHRAHRAHAPPPPPLKNFQFFF